MSIANVAQWQSNRFISDRSPVRIWALAQLVSNLELGKYLGLPYNFQHGPHVVSSEELIHQGVNCQSLVHLLYKDLFGIVLPEEMRSQEIFKDEKLFRVVDLAEEQPSLGDIFVFGKERAPNYKLHLALFTGEIDAQDELLLIHANMLEGVSVWPLSRFAQYRRYQLLKAVKRLRD